MADRTEIAVWEIPEVGTVQSPASPISGLGVRLVDIGPTRTVSAEEACELADALYAAAGLVCSLNEQVPQEWVQHLAEQIGYKCEMLVDGSIVLLPPTVELHN
jgi:hypothetical protein